VAQQTVTELIVEDKSAAGVASYVRGMRSAQQARDQLTDTERAAQQAQQRSTAVMLGLSDSTNRTRQAWQRLKEGIDPVTRAQREFEQAALRSDAALRRGIATQNEVNRVLQVYKQRLNETQRAQREPSAFGGAAQGALQGFAGRSTAGGAIAGLGGAGLAAGAAVTGLAAAAGAVATYGDAWVSLGNRLKAAGVASTELAAEQQKVVDIALASRSELTATNDLYSKFIGVTQTLGVSQDKAAVATKAVTQALTLGGISAAQATGTILQLGQALGSGVLRGDEFNSVMEGLGNQSPIIKAIAREFGVATTELRGLAEAGELVADRVFKAIIEAQPQIEAAFNAMDPTLGGAWNNATTAATNFFGALNDGLGISTTMASALLKLAEGGNAAAEGLRNAFAEFKKGSDFAAQERTKVAQEEGARFEAAKKQAIDNYIRDFGGETNRDRLSGSGVDIQNYQDMMRRRQAAIQRSRSMIGGFTPPGASLGWSNYYDLPLPPPRPGSEKGEVEGYLYNDEDKLAKASRSRRASTALTPEERGENAFERALADQDRRNKLLMLEAESVGKSNAERERSETIINLEAKAMEANRLARKADISVTEEQRRAILAMADATAQATQRLEEAKEAEKDRIAAMDDLRDTTKGIFSDIGHGIAQGKSGKEILRGLLGKMGGQLIDTGAQNLTDSLLGKQGKAGGGMLGGLLGGLLGGGQRGSTPANPVYVSMGIGGVGGAGIPSLSGLFAESGGASPANALSATQSAPANVPSLAGLMLGGKLNPGAAFAYLKSKGLNDVQAAVALGNFKQESGLNPSALNAGEGAFGLYQTRLGRRSGLNSFASGQGMLPSDPRAQMDNMLREMRTTEAGPGSRFLGSTDLASANSAMKSFIRYGDDSYGARLGYSQQYLNQFGGRRLGGGGGGDYLGGGAGTDQFAQVPGALDRMTQSTTALTQAAAQTTPALGGVTEGFGSLGSSLSSLGSMIGQGVGGPKGGSIGGGIGGIFSSIFGGLFGGGGGGSPIFGTAGLFDEGGYTGHGARKQPAGIVHRGEVVFSQRDIARNGGVGAVESMRRGGRRAQSAMPSWRGGDTHITVQGNADEKTLNEMQRQIAASEARQRADLSRNFNRYQASNAAQWADSD